MSFQYIIFFAIIGMLGVYLKLCHKFHWFDHPDESRKLHSTTIPTAAGMVFMMPVIIYYLLLPILSPINSQLIAGLALILLLLGAYDDFKPISAKLRLVVITLIAGYFVYAVFALNELNLLLLLVYVIGLIWWLNLFNFMDGADGIAASHAIITGLGYMMAYMVLSNGSIFASVYLLLFVLCLLAFLLFNFPKAKIFMGDSGSLSVAFVLAAFALYGIKNQLFGEVLVVSFHLTFIVDATLTLFVRLKYKQKLTQAHSLHLFQLLIRNGMSHAWVTVLYSFVTAILVMISLILHKKQVGMVVNISVLLIEVLILSILWFYFQNKTKFKQFQS